MHACVAQFAKAQLIVHFLKFTLLYHCVLCTKISNISFYYEGTRLDSERCNTLVMYAFLKLDSFSYTVMTLDTLLHEVEIDTIILSIK